MTDHTRPDFSDAHQTAADQIEAAIEAKTALESCDDPTDRDLLLSQLSLSLALVQEALIEMKEVADPNDEEG